MRQYREGEQIFDGFMYRPFQENLDGWRNVIPQEIDYPCVRNAKDVLSMFDELQAAYKRIWELEKEVDRWTPEQYKKKKEPNSNEDVA